MTGNWWAARSTDGGNTFSYLDPFSDFSNFCCDQDVIYNDKHDVWIWYRQGLPDPSLGGTIRNEIKIGVSTDDAATWCTYTLNALDINSGLTDHFVDYPHLQTTDDKLYLSTNIFDSTGLDTFTAMLRFDLSELSNCSDISYHILLTSTEFNFTSVNGATDTMYFGTHNFFLFFPPRTTIYSWQDSSTFVNSNVVSYPSWSPLGYSCPMPDTGANPCDRSTGRITGGYLSNGILGFVWDAAQGGSFPFPYVYYITVDAASGSLIESIPLFSNSFAANYGNFGVNNAGDIGIGLFLMGGALTPVYVVGIDDPQTGTNEFDFVTVKASTHGPIIDTWGDYVRIKPYKPDNGQWIGTGFTMQGGSTSSNVENLFVIFGRDITPPNTPPTVTITSPASFSEFTEGESISFSGTATDMEDGNIASNLQWTSDIDGSIGNGASLSNSELSVGTHAITAFVTDSDGTNDSKQIPITVNEIPPCSPPVSDDWMITESCKISSDVIAPASVMIQNNSVVTVSSDGSLTILSGENIIIVKDSGLKLIQGSKLQINS